MNLKLLVLMAVFLTEPTIAENLRLDQFFQQVEKQNLDLKTDTARVESSGQSSFKNKLEASY